MKNGPVHPWVCAGLWNAVQKCRPADFAGGPVTMKMVRYTQGLLVETAGRETDWEAKPGVTPQCLSPNHNPMECKALP